jgi:adenylate kinase family enzyme
MSSYPKKITVFLGLPGSGKSTVAQQLLENEVGSDIKAFLWDDLNVMINNLKGDWHSIVQPVQNNHIEHLIITEVMGYITDTQPAMLKKLKEFFPQASQKWIFFENELAVCQENVARRHDGRVIDGTLKIVSKNYHGVHPVIMEQCEVEHHKVYRHPIDVSSHQTTTQIKIKP